MKNRKASRRWLLASLFLAPTLPLFAAEDPALRVKLQEPEPPTKNRFGVSYRAAFNITAQFKNVGNVATGSKGLGPGPATGNKVDRVYDDGYNRVDSSESHNGITWFWAYKNPSQITPDDTVVMHSATAHSITSKTIDSDPEHGFELTYNRELGRIGKNKNLPWGLEVGCGWTDIAIKDHRPLAGPSRIIADAYNTLGIDPSRNIIAPGRTTPDSYTEIDTDTGATKVFHPGQLDGPGSTIETTPHRTTTSDPRGSFVTGNRQFDADLFSFRLGPYIEIPLDDRWSLSFSAGVAAGVIDGEFRFDQNVTAGGNTTHQVGVGSEGDILFGGYLSASIRCAINEQWSVFASGQYLGLSDYSATARGQKVEIDLARTAFLALGVSFSF